MSLNEHNITSGEQYASLLVEEIEYLRHTGEAESPLADELYERWYKYITKACVERYQEYVTGKEDSFKLSDVEMEKLYEQALSDIIDESLESLVDKGFVSLSVGDSGEILYSATKEGLDKLKDNDRKKS